MTSLLQPFEKTLTKRKALREKYRGIRVVVCTGTPSAGKTVIARRLAKKLKARYVDVNKIIKKYKLSVGYDKARKSKIINIPKFKKIMDRMIKDSKRDLVIDSHLSHYVDSRLVDLCIVARCSLKTLKKRLMKRGYHKSKVRENLDAEIFDICLMEAIALGHRIKIIDTTKGIKGRDLLI